jgi:hypothetical protein
MRFISRYGRFSVTIRRHEQEAYANGAVRVIQPEITASFQPNRLTPLEREMAVHHWTFNGSMQEADEATIYPPDYRIGLYDSLEHQRDAGFDDDLREEIEAKLVENAEQYPNIIVVRSNVPAPWPRYDDFRGTPGQLLRRLVEDGHDLETVLAYESEHQNRPKIVAELEQAIETGAIDVGVELEEEVVG